MKAGPAATSGGARIAFMTSNHRPDKFQGPRITRSG